MLTIASKADVLAALDTKFRPGAVRVPSVVRVCKTDSRKGIAYGVVYAPHQLDSQTEMMTAEEVEDMAHRFMQLDLSRAIDEQHDFNPTECYPVESFIARKGDLDYPEGAWVLGVKLTSEMVTKFDSGELNGFSFAGMVTPRDVDVEYASVRDVLGETETSSAHEHAYMVELDDTGRVVRGITSEVDGHTHVITRASVTETSVDHVHRFFL